jgi:hypothetical protein
MSSNAFDSRGANVNVNTGAVPGHATVAMKHRYVAVTSKLDVYDVLNTRTSEKNGFPPCIDAAAGNVTTSPAAAEATRRRIAANGPRRGGSLISDLRDVSHIASRRK